MNQAGAALKAERLKQNKTLRDIARTTRISVLTLEAIEGDHIEFTPPPIYARGFIKTYALELELDPAEIVALYDREINEQHKQPPPERLKKDSRRIPGYLVPVILVAVLLLACALYFGYMGRGTDSASSQPAVPTAEDYLGQTREPAEMPAPAIAPPAPEAPEAQAADNGTAGAAANFTVRFTATERSWMRFTVDGRHVFDVLLKAGETYSVNAVSSLTVRIGNPGGLQVFYNDKPVEVPGKRNRPVNMSFPVAPHAKPSP